MPVGIAKRAFNDDVYCGDACACWRKGPQTILCVVDGLGHGRYAEKAAQAALAFVARHCTETLEVIIAGCDKALRSTRGAAMGIAVIHEHTGKLTFGGVGNIRAMIVGEGNVHLTCSPGIMGAGYKKLLIEELTLSPSDLVLMFTDGLDRFTDLSKYGEPLGDAVQSLAESIFRDWSRETDDAAILVYRSKE